MADATITIKLTPTEYRDMRAELEEQATDLHERAREVRGDSPRESRTLTEREARLKFLLEKI